MKIQSATISRAGAVSTGSTLMNSALTSSDVTAVLAGRSVSAQRRINGQLVLLEVRPTTTGGIALVQKRADATAAGDQAIRRILWALLIAVLIAVALGLLVAIRISRPLRRTAAAAHALAAGHRDVAVRPEGPSEVVEVATAVNTLAGALSHSEARQREFLLSVSHELRTPLTAIAGYAESLADGVVPAEQAGEVGAIMLTEAHRLNRLVADLLDLARLDAQEFRVDLGTVDIVEVVRAAGRVWSDRCARADVPFLVEAPDWPVLIQTDPARLRQILDGLLENALRVTPSGRPIVLAARGEYLATGQPVGVVEVRDGGPGLADQDLAVAFDRSVLYERYRGRAPGRHRAGAGHRGRADPPAGRDGRSGPRTRGWGPLHRAAAGRLSLPDRQPPAAYFLAPSSTWVAVSVPEPVPSTITVSPLLTSPMVPALPLPSAREWTLVELFTA